MESDLKTGENDNDGELLLDVAAEWLLRLEAAPGDMNVRAGLQAWIDADPAHADAYARISRMWSVAGHMSERDVRYSSRRRPVVFVATAALAACLLLAIFPTVELYLKSDYLTGTGEVRNVTLADGSVVTLDAGSGIDVRFDDGLRQIELLQGQAFFDIVEMPNRPFSVDAGGVRATVTGTKFSVRTGAEDVTVALASGGVEVMRIGAAVAPVRLAPGERAIVARSSGIEKSKATIAEIAAWRRGRLIIRNETLANVVERLNSYHPGVIVISDPALGSTRVTGNFDLAHPAEALDAVVRAGKGSVIRLTPYLLVVGGR